MHGTMDLKFMGLKFGVFCFILEVVLLQNIPLIYYKYLTNRWNELHNKHSHFVGCWMCPICSCNTHLIICTYQIEWLQLNKERIAYMN